MSPIITVILPTHNRPTLLREAAESVSRQTFLDWELIIVDDGSSPPVDIAALGLPKDKVRLFRHPVPRGGAAAKNTGIAAARGEIVAFLDDDDRYAPAYLERALWALEKNPDIEVVFMGIEWFGDKAHWNSVTCQSAMDKILAEAGGNHTDSGLVVFGDRLVAALLNRVPMPFQRPVVRRSAIGKIGVYRESCLLWDCDWATWAALRTKTGLLDEPLYQQRVSDQGYSSKQGRLYEHLQSAIEIRERLLSEAKQDPSLARWRSLFHAAASNAWFDFAYDRCQQGSWRASFIGWGKSQRHQLSIARIRLLWRIAKRMVLKR
ncbi:MAG: glycosyltransferase family 2 protein [Gammaproteobacteria bacterium]|nr:glycosyltransferase family 2 protein [Gammaproteobacteria bacterium]